MVPPNPLLIEGVNAALTPKQETPDPKLKDEPSYK